MVSKKAIAAAWMLALPAVAVVSTITTRPVDATSRLVDANTSATPVDSKSLFTEKCSACHDLPKPTELSYTPAEWRGVVHKMLTKYGASDEISPAEADQITDYLATFAPKPAPAGPLRGPRRWQPEEDDIWPETATRSTMTNFESIGVLSHLSTAVDGDHSRPKWQLESMSKSPDGTAVRVSNAGAGPDAYALLIDPRTSGSDVDVRIRFKIAAGHTSPAIGIAVGVKDSRDYDVVRFDRTSNDLALIQVAEPTHTTVQSTPIQLGDTSGQTVAFNGGDGGWHILRVQVRGGHVRAWIDSYKRINVDLPDYTGGNVALWSQGDTTAVFDDWSTDVYDPASGGAVPSTQ